MGYEGPVLRPRCIGPRKAQTQIPFNSIQITLYTVTWRILVNNKFKRTGKEAAVAESTIPVFALWGSVKPWKMVVLAMPQLQFEAVTSHTQCTSITEWPNCLSNSLKNWRVHVRWHHKETKQVLHCTCMRNMSAWSSKSISTWTLPAWEIYPLDPVQVSLPAWEICLLDPVQVSLPAWEICPLDPVQVSLPTLYLHEK